MNIQEVQRWLQQSRRRVLIVQHLPQPMTATQLSRRIDISCPCCTGLFFELSLYRLLDCLNPLSRRSRLYWLTSLGQRCQNQLRRQAEKERLIHDFPVVDWELYGWVCYSHRSSILRTLKEPMQAATIKRRAKLHDPNLRMSANNVRDVLRLFLAKSIVNKLTIPGKAHPRYELTELGKKLQILLNRAVIL